MSDAQDLSQSRVYPGPWCEEFQTIEIKLYRTAGMRILEYSKTVKQQIGSKIINPAIEIVADRSDRPGIGSMVLGCTPLSFRHLRCFW